MKEIAIMGTHGVGKTTLAHQVCVALKERNCNVTVVEERARSCPFPINEDATTDTEIWMILTQIRAELHAKAQLFDVAVTDRCSLDVMVYWHAVDPDNRHLHLLRQVAVYWFEERYDMVLWVEPSEDDDKFAVDQKRSACLEYRQHIRDLFRSHVDALPDSCHDKILRVDSSEIFGGSERESAAVSKLLAHPLCDEILAAHNPV